MYFINGTEKIEFKNVESKDIKYLSVNEGFRWNIKGAIFNGLFVPNSIIEEMYKRIYRTDIEPRQCKEIPNTNKYEYYQWNGNPEDIKDIPFLKQLYEDGCFTIGAKDYENYHLDFCTYGGEITDIRPGDYIINKEDNIEIVEKDEFEKRYFYKK